MAGWVGGFKEMLKWVVFPATGDVAPPPPWNARHLHFSSNPTSPQLLFFFKSYLTLIHAENLPVGFHTSEDTELKVNSCSKINILFLSVPHRLGFIQRRNTHTLPPPPPAAPFCSFYPSTAEQIPGVQLVSVNYICRLRRRAIKTGQYCFLIRG